MQTIQIYITSRYIAGNPDVSDSKLESELDQIVEELREEIGDVDMVESEDPKSSCKKEEDHRPNRKPMISQPELQKASSTKKEVRQ